MDLLKFNTAGSVDDGKSTLIGRLLYDSVALTAEQQQLIERKTKEKGMSDLDFSVLTDGLIAEREQGITIDVAHIYFSSQKRKFIIADTPGHIEYTRNMVTGASNSDASVILIDARKGLLEQSHRHFYISQLLRLPVVIFCVNKMDLVGYAEEVFLKIAVQIEKMVDNATFSPEVQIIPISSLKGDNVVHKSKAMPWYKGATLLNNLEKIQLKEKQQAFRMDVQQVLHVQNNNFKDFRGLTGRILSGELHLGEKIMALPSGQTAAVIEIRKHTSLLDVAEKDNSVLVRLDRELDASRGTLLCKTNEVPTEGKSLNTTLVWLNDKHATIGDTFILQAGSRRILARIDQIINLIDPEHPNLLKEATQLILNDIAEVSLKMAALTFLDSYVQNKQNGVFILIDRQTNETLAVGFVN